MEELNDIERAIKSTLVHTSPMGEAWFEEHWKPKFDKVRRLMVTPTLMKTMYDMVFEMMESEPWHGPFDELQNKNNCPICNSTTGSKECLCCGQEKPE
jgi:hypothetical protein